MLLHPYFLLTNNERMKIALVGAHAGVVIYINHLSDVVGIFFWVQTPVHTTAYEPHLNPLLLLLALKSVILSQGAVVWSFED